MKPYLIALGMFLSLPAFANDNPDLFLNKVVLQLSAEQWVTTKTALVNVAVNASLTNKGIEKIQNETIQKLNQLAKLAEWHIVSFDRQLDKSGLESVQITAQARIAQADLAGIRDRAKSISEPGTTFTIDQIQFTPSEEDIRIANNVMRNNIYQQVKSEVDTLNKTYPNQNYSVYQINFLSGPIAISTPTANVMFNAKMADANGANLSIGNKQELRATVMLASLSSIPSDSKTQANKP